jgi:hypothetical protein
MAPRDNSPEEEAEGLLKTHREYTKLWIGIALVEFSYFATQLGLLLSLFWYNKNYLWIIFNLFFVFVLDLPVSGGILSALHLGGLQDLVYLDLIPIIQWGSFCCFGDRRGLSIWMVWQNVFWAALVLLWIKPAFLYTDAFGGSFGGRTSLAGRSSCSNVVFTEANGQCTQSFPGPSIVYNPLGAFDANNGYQENGIYASCLLEQRWAGPTFTGGIWLPGFARVDGLNDCNNMLATGGVVSRFNCPTAQQVCLNGYPGLWYGLNAATTTPLVLMNTTAQPLWCPGNTGAQVYINGIWVGGKPRPVCSFCLWYTIYQAQVSGQLQAVLNKIPQDVISTCLPGWNQAVNYPPDDWAGWRSYPDGTTDPSGLCGFCPGWGVGWWGFDTEVYDSNGVQTSYWYYTAVALIVPGARKVLIGFVLFVMGMRKCCHEEQIEGAKRRRREGCCKSNCCPAAIKKAHPKKAHNSNKAIKTDV